MQVEVYNTHTEEYVDYGDILYADNEKIIVDSYFEDGRLSKQQYDLKYFYYVDREGFCNGHLIS